jgi:hypothetical protein
MLIILFLILFVILILRFFLHLHTISFKFNYQLFNLIITYLLNQKFLFLCLLFIILYLIYYQYTTNNFVLY